MKNTGLLSIALLAATIATAQNSCSTAISVGVGSYVVSAVDGPEIPDPICAQNGLGNTSASEWYAFTATGINTITVSTDLPGSQGVDTRINVYSGSCGSLTCVGGDDDSGDGNTSIASWNSVTGVTYLIAFDNRCDHDLHMIGKANCGNDAIETEDGIDHYDLCHKGTETFGSG